MAIDAISAITFATHNMARAVRFYRDLGFNLKYGGEEASFTSLCAGTGFVNLTVQPVEREWSWWGRVVFRVADVDEIYSRALDLGYTPDSPPKDAVWGERYFHITDPDGHELSFARPL